MPINRKFGLERLLKSCGDYFEATGRRISFEYALIAGVNDSAAHAERLSKLLRGVKGLPPHSFHVNLIPVNEVRGKSFKRSENAKAFAEMLGKSKINATVRRTMGADINAACGQLRRSQK
jgi:23S rRNA (adenine2503-C2)-methyltransferase